MPANIVTGTLLLESQHIYALINDGATHSFIAKKQRKVNVQYVRIEKGQVISTPLKEVITIRYMYKGCRVDIGDYALQVNLIPLELHDFNVILGMNFLVRYRAQMDCFTKTVTLQGDEGRKIVFR